jgi:hypothetical protein
MDPFETDCKQAGNEQTVDLFDFCCKEDIPMPYRDNAATMIIAGQGNSGTLV